MERRLTLKEDAENLRWGPTISEPQTEAEVLDYVLAVFGSSTEPRSLGMVYAYKMLLWMQAQRQAGRVPV